MQSKHLDSCIEVLKQMLGDQTNELESEQRRALAAHARKLKRLRRQANIDHVELYKVVAEVAEVVSKILQ